MPQYANRTAATIAAKKAELARADAASRVYLAAEEARRMGVPNRRIALLALLGCGARVNSNGPVARNNRPVEE